MAHIVMPFILRCITLFGVGSVILLGEERMNNPIRGDIIVDVNA
ncbi:hypothetical protein ACV22V_20360 [Burkholderia sp. AW33-5]